MAVSQTLSVTEVAGSPSVASNTSKVRILWKSTQSGSSYNANTRTANYWISINGGSEKEYSVSYTLPSGTTKTILDTTITVTHKDDGSGTVKVRTWMDTRISAGEIKLEKSATLTTIARASTIDHLSCATDFFTGEMTYKYTPRSSGFYNRCNIALNLDGEYIAVRTINIGKASASQHTGTVTLSDSQLATVYNHLPGTTRGTLRFTLRTYSDSGYSNQVGDAVYKEVRLRIPEVDATKPTARMTLSPNSTLKAPFDSLYIRGRSKLEATITDQEGKYEADITSCRIVMNGTSYDTPCTTGYLTDAGDIPITGIITDSRGFTREYEQTITVLPYAAPRIIPAAGESAVVAARCNADGDISDSGTYLKIKAKRSYNKVESAGVQMNFCQIRYRYKLEAAASYSSWTTILAKNSLGSDEIITEALLGGVLDAQSTYLVQVQAIDDMGESASATITVPTDKVYWHRDGARNSFTFGGYVEEDNTFAIAAGVDFKVKSVTGETVVVSDTGWISLGLSDSVVEREDVAGRIGKGCYYRVINGNHVYVAFCCQFTFADNKAVTINKDMIPEKYRPPNHMYQHCIACDRTIARCKVRPQGDVVVDWVQVLSANAITTSYEVLWIDGYIDYWI